MLKHVSSDVGSAKFCFVFFVNFCMNLSCLKKRWTLVPSLSQFRGPVFCPSVVSAFRSSILVKLFLRTSLLAPKKKEDQHNSFSRKCPTRPTGFQFYHSYKNSHSEVVANLFEFVVFAAMKFFSLVDVHVDQPKFLKHNTKEPHTTKHRKNTGLNFLGRNTIFTSEFPTKLQHWTNTHPSQSGGESWARSTGHNVAMPCEENMIVSIRSTCTLYTYR